MADHVCNLSDLIHYQKQLASRSQPTSQHQFGAGKRLQPQSVHRYQTYKIVHELLRPNLNGPIIQRNAIWCKGLRWGGNIRNKNSYCEQPKTMYPIVRALFPGESEIVKLKVWINMGERRAGPF